MGYKPVTDPEILKQLNAPPPAPQAAPAAGGGWMDTAADMGTQAIAGLARGGEMLMGAPGDVASMATPAIQWAAGKMGVDPATTQALLQSRMLNPLAAAPTSRQISEFTGPLPEPQTTPGKYVRTTAEFVPGAAVSAAVGGTPVVQSLLANALAPGLASEAAGQLTEGTAAEPYARLAAAMAGQGIGNKGVTAYNREKLIRGAPDVDALAQKNYDVLDRGGVQLTPQGYTNVTGNVDNMVAGRNAPYDVAEAQRQAGTLKRYTDPTFNEVQRMRSGLSNDMRKAWKSGDKNAMEAVEAVRDKLDEGLAGLTPADVSSGSITPQQAIGALKEGDKYWSRAKKAEDIQRRIVNAQESAGPANWNTENAYRIEARNLGKAARKKPGMLSPDEMAVVSEMSRAGPMRQMSRFAPSGILSGGTYGGLAALGSVFGLPGGPIPAAIAAGATGTARAVTGVDQARNMALLEALAKYGGTAPGGLPYQSGSQKLLNAILAGNTGFRSQQ